MRKSEKPESGKIRIDQVMRPGVDPGLFFRHTTCMIGEITSLTLFLLISAAFFGGLVDSIAGGGGLITLPALLAVGLPPHVALATNKLQAVFGSCTAAVNYGRKQIVPIKKMIPGVIFTAVGASTGAVLVQQMSAGFLEFLIPFVLLALFIYTLLSPGIGLTESHSRLPVILFLASGGILIGFYDGFFGPGTGSFWTMAFVLLAGYDLKQATAGTKIMNFTSNFFSLMIFLIGGKPVLIIGLTMASGQIAGAFLGSHLVMLRGVKFIKPVFLAMTGLICLKLFRDMLF